MITDIFSAFDPQNSSSFNLSSPLFWTISFIPILITINNIWISSPLYMWNTLKIVSTINEQVNRTSGHHLKAFSALLSSIFSSLILINLIGLIPYFFRLSSHLIFTFSLGIPIWLSLIISAVIHQPKKVVANLLPSGAPDWLNPALILIETLRILIRPLTLCFRLAANITAGHIVLGLVGLYSATALSSLSLSFFTLISIQIAYRIFEFAICIIQAYIFCLLLSLYSDEHPTLIGASSTLISAQKKNFIPYYLYM